MLSRILIPLAQMRLQKYGGNVLRRRVKRERNEEKTEKMIGIEEVFEFKIKKKIKKILKMKKIREEIQKQRETDPKENFKVNFKMIFEGGKIFFKRLERQIMLTRCLMERKIIWLLK